MGGQSRMDNLGTPATLDTQDIGQGQIKQKNTTQKIKKMSNTTHQPGPGLGGAGPNAVLCETCIVLLCVLEQPRVDNPSAVPNWESLIQ